VSERKQRLDQENQQYKKTEKHIQGVQSNMDQQIQKAHQTVMADTR